MGVIFFQGKLALSRKHFGEINPSKGSATEERRREQVSSAVRQDTQTCPTQCRGWSEKYMGKVLQSWRAERTLVPPCICIFEERLIPLWS